MLILSFTWRTQYTLLVKKWNPSPLACPPLAYQPIGGLVNLVRHKNDSLEVLQFTKLTIAWKLVVWPWTLDAHKKFVMVPDNSKLNWLETLIRAGLKGDMGIHGMIELLDHATKGVYNPHRYTEEETLHAFLFLQCGGLPCFLLHLCPKRLALQEWFTFKKVVWLRFLAFCTLPTPCKLKIWYFIFWNCLF